MRSRLQLVLLSLLLAACTASQSEGRCLYAIELEFGRDTRWGSCTSPPACAIERLSGGERERVGAGCG